MRLTWNEKGEKAKAILPRPGVSMIFTDKKIWIKDKSLPDNILIGIHDDVFNFKWTADTNFCFIIKFSPYGLSRFLRMNMHQMANQLVESATLWGNSINSLHEEIMMAEKMTQQVELVENFFSERMRGPTKTEESIFQFADVLRKERGHSSLNDLRKSVPMSTRQLERKFKELTGVDIRTYIRICRFERAKLLLIQERNLKLTEVGYASGYFDQAHFSNEFKMLSKFRPKNFLGSSPFYKYLSEMERRKNLVLE